MIQGVDVSAAIAATVVAASTVTAGDASDSARAVRTGCMIGGTEGDDHSSAIFHNLGGGVLCALFIVFAAIYARRAVKRR